MLRVRPEPSASRARLFYAHDRRRKAAQSFEASALPMELGIGEEANAVGQWSGLTQGIDPGDEGLEAARIHEIQIREIKTDVRHHEIERDAVHLFEVNAQGCHGRHIR